MAYLRSAPQDAWSLVKDRTQQYALLARLDRPIGALLLLWPTLWGLWIAAEGDPDTLVFLVFVAGVFLMRSAGCVINDYIDRKIDRRVSRTRNRPIATGRVAPWEALVLFTLLSLLAFALVLLMNRLTVLLSLVAVLLAMSYPLMKRYTHLPQLYLGAAFGWGIPMVFAAQTGSISGTAWWLFCANLVWVVAYDTLYAMVDRDDDIKIGVKSTAILFGRYDRILVGCFHLVAVGILFMVGQRLSFEVYYHLGLVCALVFAVYQQLLIRKRQQERCLLAFLNNSWLGATVWVGIVLQYAMG